MPHRTSTDHGTRTLDVAQRQICLHHKYGGVPKFDLHKHHVYTTSPHNQKIESLWSQLMRAKNTAIRDNIDDAIDRGIYHPGIPLEE